MSDAIIPSEAYDETHPDHDWWVRKTGRCFANHAHADESWRDVPTYVGYCCREWILAAATAKPGRCGLCGEVPRYLREDEK